MTTVAAACAPAPATSATPPTANHLLDAPLGELLAELDVDVYDASITDRSFFGAVGQRKSGRLFLALPLDRSDFERDTTARYLLAQVFDVDLPELSAPFATVKI